MFLKLRNAMIGLNLIARLRAIIMFSRQVDILATLKWNFKFFPFGIAKKLPLYIGYDVDFQGVNGGGAC